MKRLEPLTWAFLGLVAFSILGSALSKWGRPEPGFIAPLASAATILVGCLAVLRSGWRAQSWKRFDAIAFAFALGGGAELSSLTTGLPFGRYEYTSAWAPTVAFAGGRFPLLVPFAWLLVVAGCYSVAQEWAESRWLRAAITGVLAVGIDLVMEPVMAGPLDYWRWIDRGPMPGGAPVLNSIGWFAIASLAGLGFALAWRVRYCPRQAAFVLAGHLVLTLSIGAIHA